MALARCETHGNPIRSTRERLPSNAAVSRWLPKQWGDMRFDRMREAGEVMGSQERDGRLSERAESFRIWETAHKLCQGSRAGLSSKLRDAQRSRIDSL